MGNRLAHVSSVICAAYDAAIDPKLWPQVLTGLSEIVRCKAASISMMDPMSHNKLSLSIGFGTDAYWEDLLHTTYAALCPIGPIMMFAEIDEPTCMWDYITEEEFRETRFYKEWCTPQDIYHFAGTVIAKTPTEIGSLSFIRGRWDNPFDDADFETIKVVAPHVRRAVTIAGLLKHQAVELSSLSNLMKQLSTAILIVDAKGRLLESNPAADALLAQEGAVRLSDGRLSLKNHAPGNGLLDKAFAACDGRAAGAAHRSGGPVAADGGGHASGRHAQPVRRARPRPDADASRHRPAPRRHLRLHPARGGRADAAAGRQEPGRDRRHPRRLARHRALAPGAALRQDRDRAAGRPRPRRHAGHAAHRRRLSRGLRFHTSTQY